MEPQSPTFSFQVAPELAAGRYSNMLGVWHSPHEFTLDFAVTMPVVHADGADGPPTVPCEVVARIKVSPSLIFDLLRALNENMTQYEQNFGEIKRPEPPGGPS